MRYEDVLVAALSMCMSGASQNLGITAYFYRLKKKQEKVMQKFTADMKENRVNVTNYRKHFKAVGCKERRVFKIMPHLDIFVIFENIFLFYTYFNRFFICVYLLIYLF